MTDVRNVDIINHELKKDKPRTKKGYNRIKTGYNRIKTGNTGAIRQCVLFRSCFLFCEVHMDEYILCNKG